MGDKVKVAVLEYNGTEYDVPTEEPLKASIVELDPTLSGHDDIQKFANNFGSGISFSFGRAGNSQSGTSLIRTGKVPSNVVGYRIKSVGAKLIAISADNETSTSYTVEIFTHDGNGSNEEIISSLAVSGSKGSSSIVSESIDTGKHLAARISSGSAKNVEVTCYIQGQNS